MVKYPGHRLLQSRHPQALDQVFLALADPTRRAILTALHQEFQGRQFSTGDVLNAVRIAAWKSEYA